MAKNLYAVSDGLLELRRQLQDFTQTGVMFSGAAVRALMTRLKDLGIEAQQNEHEIYRHRWNEQARNDQATETAVADEATRPGTNLVLLARSGTPFSDGHRPGGAA
jgi:hypothetical protein